MTEAVVLSLVEKTHPTQYCNRDNNLLQFTVVHSNTVFPRTRQVKLKEEMMETHTPASYLFKHLTNHCHFPQNAVLFFIFYLGRSIEVQFQGLLLGLSANCQICPFRLYI